VRRVNQGANLGAGFRYASFEYSEVATTPGTTKPALGRSSKSLLGSLSGTRSGKWGHLLSDF
jgi:hypothetical protein